MLIDLFQRSGRPSFSWRPPWNSVQLVGSILSATHHFANLFFFSRNYDHVSALWQYEGWISEGTVDIARAHYAAYMVRRADGLRIITINANLCESSLLLNAAITVHGRYLQGISTYDSKIVANCCA